MKKRYLILEDGNVFCGYSFGADKQTTGELVFSTDVCGYVGSLTDPAYTGQILLGTFPLFGNYGVNISDCESGYGPLAYVVREYCREPSNFRCDTDVDSFLKARGIPGIYGIDTREVVKIIREKGSVKAYISNEPSIPEELRAITPSHAAVSFKVKKELSENGKYSVALLDLGMKKSVSEELIKRNCKVTVLPFDTDAEEIIKYDGLVVSGGPEAVEDGDIPLKTLTGLLSKIPVFAIGRGHQILAEAAGGKINKMKVGHRGSNHGVRDLLGTRSYIVNQNHGYAVEKDSGYCGITRYVNTNDGSVEGIDYPNKKAFGIQFYPEGEELAFLYDRFVSMLGGEC
ncbi:MAG: carbamoyl phosphate synthase small subunit [Ruminococcaceae bacterium]|nr:carbamoyl phosphate synthase small subunit [Oscillospiraceae bacterium]